MINLDEEKKSIMYQPRSTKIFKDQLRQSKVNKVNQSKKNIKLNQAMMNLDQDQLRLININKNQTR